MRTADKVYRIISIANLCKHILLFAFVLYSCFLPFHEGENFFQRFDGFFGERFREIQPYLILSLLLIACVFAFLAIRQPVASLGILGFTFAFFIIIVYPYAIEAMFVGLAQWAGADMSVSEYQAGFQYMSFASTTIYLDGAFFLYSFIHSVVMLFIRDKNLKHKQGGRA